MMDFKTWLYEVGDTPWDAAPRQNPLVTINAKNPGAFLTYSQDDEVEKKRKGGKMIPPKMKKRLKK